MQLLKKEKNIIQTLISHGDLLQRMTPKKLWKMIDYDDKGSKSVTSTSSVRENLIHNYFSHIFQAKRLEENPTVADIGSIQCSYSRNGR